MSINSVMALNEIYGDARRRIRLEDGMLACKPSSARWWTLPEIVERLQQTYCGTLAAEFEHVFTSYALIPARHLWDYAFVSG